MSETLKVLLQRFCYKKQTKNGFHGTICHAVLRSLQMCNCISVKANSNEICEEISFTSFFFQKNADANIFVEIHS